MHDDNTEITFNDFKDDSSPSSYGRKQLEIKKHDAKRKLEEYFENKSIENEWYDY